MFFSHLCFTYVTFENCPPVVVFSMWFGIFHIQLV